VRCELRSTHNRCVLTCRVQVGYGDLLPSTDGSKVFTMVYVTLGTMMVVG
jgi:hypothetical protein